MAVSSSDMFVCLYLGIMLMWPASSLQNADFDKIAGLLATHGL